MASKMETHQSEQCSLTRCVCPTKGGTPSNPVFSLPDKRLIHPERVRLPDLRDSITHRRDICGYKCYFTVSFFDGHADDLLKPAEVFVKVAKHGSMIAGLIDGLCTIISTSLQYGVPWDAIKQKLLNHVFERHEDPLNTSLLDGFAKAIDFLIAERKSRVIDGEPPKLLGVSTPDKRPPEDTGDALGSGQVDSPKGPPNTLGSHAETPKAIEVSAIPRVSLAPRMSGGVPLFEDVRPVHGFGGGPPVGKPHASMSMGHTHQWCSYEDGSEFHRTVSPSLVSNEYWLVGKVVYDMAGGELATKP